MKHDSDYMHNLRHSAAHLLAAAVMDLYPEAKRTIGPAIDDGFYFDFDFGDVKVSEKDLPKIEKRMRQIVKQWEGFERTEYSPEEAKERYAGNEYKHELIDEFAGEGQVISFYTVGNYEDLCRGGHVDDAKKELQHFKLLSIAGAYWRGDEHRPMLTRIYGTVWPSKQELDDHLHMLEEAKKRDHRKLGRELELYFIDDMVGKGLVMWLPKGQVVRDEIESLAKERERAVGYQRVTTPHIAKEELFLTSGHLPYYKDDMYPAMQMDDGTYYLKAMNCPHHHRIYLHKPRSYRDLPLRLAEYGMCYRNELSGTLAGLLRVRGLAMNDAHLYIRKDQIKDEIESVIRLTQGYFELFGLKDYWFRLSKWDPSRTDKYIDEPENWEYAEAMIRSVLEDMKVPFVEADDEAAFYGPKVDVQFKSVIGREETMSTIQLDFIAKQRFGLSYTDQDGTLNNEVFVIHRAPLSVHERFLAFVIEHFAGAFPVWLSPVQVVVIPVSEAHSVYADEVAATLAEADVRVEVWRDESMGKRIRTAEKQKVPYMLVLGDKEQADQSVAVRARGQEDRGTLPVDVFVDMITNNIEGRVLEV